MTTAMVTVDGDDLTTCSCNIAGPKEPHPKCCGQHATTWRVGTSVKSTGGTQITTIAPLCATHAALLAKQLTKRERKLWNIRDYTSLEAVRALVG